MERLREGGAHGILWRLRIRDGAAAGQAGEDGQAMSLAAKPKGGVGHGHLLP